MAELLTDYPIVIQAGDSKLEFHTKQDFLDFCKEEVFFLDQEESHLEKMNDDLPT